MAAANKRDKNMFNQLLVADDDPRHLDFDLIKGAAGALHSLFDLCNGLHASHLLNFVRDDELHRD
jgi:hypothetical protein